MPVEGVGFVSCGQLQQTREWCKNRHGVQLTDQGETGSIEQIDHSSRKITDADCVLCHSRGGDRLQSSAFMLVSSINSDLNKLL